MIKMLVRATTAKLPVWTNPEDLRQIRLNDHELTITQTYQLVQALLDALRESGQHNP
jgi:hypothetical protein